MEFSGLLLGAISGAILSKSFDYVYPKVKTFLSTDIFSTNKRLARLEKDFEKLSSDSERLQKLEEIIKGYNPAGGYLRLGDTRPLTLKFNGPGIYDPDELQPTPVVLDLLRNNQQPIQ